MAAVSTDVLSRRALNRATLERQLLLRRADAPVLDTVHHLVGMQAQVPLNPYLGLWSRLERFRPDDLAELILDRKVVRTVVMRGTIHLVTADDALVLPRLVQPVLDAELRRHRDHAPVLERIDLGEVLTVAREILREPHTAPQLRAALAERFAEHDAAALAFACRNHLALVQVPPRGIWGRAGPVTLATAESWLGRPMADPPIDEVLLRYLGAFGPASVADMTTWSRLTGLREVVERLRPRVRVFHDESGRELVDLPDAPRPEPDVPAPPRFLPEFDNALLSHADRSRFFDADQPRLYGTGDPFHGSVLVDGTLRAVWRIDRVKTTDAATLVVTRLGRLTKRATSAVAAEGRRVLRFLAADADSHDIRMVPLD